ncbi:hypothetical protein [Sediminibacterium ginsengisoli]|uniref:Uncharacterized protein n=1 Tax=Sediminibacterium ginsengisoli TaxID=413434 RepID=A0A1T4KV38_9BACT|nr:hypothetical protein [Sediminibacterium ginsengisoli]SJZ46228.1 hypothetical protein SAMN04488132_102131 [Sediminibacterium ginsengisoli]
MSILGGLGLSVGELLAGKLADAGYKELTKKQISEYESALYDIIERTNKEFEKKCPVEEKGGIPFYKSQTLLDVLLGFRLSNRFDEKYLGAAIKADDRIIAPTKEQLQLYFEIFDRQLESIPKIKALNITSNYKEEIFLIHEALQRIEQQHSAYLALAKQQMAIQLQPDVEFRVFCQRTQRNFPYDKMGLFLEMTNHSASISINQIKVIVRCEAQGDCKGFNTWFMTTGNLKPGEQQRIESFFEYEGLIASSFPEGSVDHSGVGETRDFLPHPAYEVYPLSVMTEFLPRYKGAEMVKDTLSLFLFVKRKKP